MRLFEYQAKEIFLRYGIPVPKGQVITNAAYADQVREEIGGKVVLKAQVLFRGRTKIGGIRLVDPKEDINFAASTIFGIAVKTQKIKKILLEEAIQIKNQYVIKLGIDPYLEKPVLIASRFDIKKSLTNGMEASENRIRIPLDFSNGLLGFQIIKIAVTLEIKKELWGEFSRILFGLWGIFKDLDASSIEINPLVINDQEHFFALGALIEVEDHALFRQSEILEKKEIIYESSLQSEAEKHGISLMQYDGSIGCIFNDNAFGYAIREMLISAGGRPGIFQNLGEGTKDEKVLAGLEILINNNRTNCILVAFFGGLTRCDRVASGIIKIQNLKMKKKPLIIYLNGTNVKSGIDLLNQSGLRVENSLQNAIRKSIKVSSERI